ncbi:hypothetical protein [Streptomyces sp. NPDC057686]|uniref:hypothetical protein n=1 Tax=Streptomyces sp. NPDC057686 TaxID=3346212 RepID=UPI00367EA4FC
MSREIRSGGYSEIVAVITDENCDICQALLFEWHLNHDRDVLIEINNHPHSKPKLNRVKEWQATSRK